MDAVGAKLRDLCRAAVNQRRNAHFLRNRNKRACASRHPNRIAAGADQHARDRRGFEHRRQHSRGRSGAPVATSKSRYSLVSAGTRASPDFIAPIEADCGGNKKSVRRELFRARESGFPCHRTVFSPDFPAPAVYQATRTGQSLLGYGGFGAFLPTCGLTNRWKCRHRAPAFRFSGPLGMIKLTAFRTVGLSLLGIYFAAAARPAAADPAVQASPSGATTTYFAPSLGPAAAAASSTAAPAPAATPPTTAAVTPAAKCGACDAASQRQRQANPNHPQRPLRPPSCRQIR